MNVCGKHTINFLARGDIMKMRDVAMILVGSMATIAYQKYNKPVMKAMKKTFDENVKNAKEKLEDMM